MNIQEALKTLIAERNFERTPKGRSVSENALDSLSAAIKDVKNHHVDAIICLNCGIILSSILTTNTKGCVNCGGINLTTNIEKGELL